MSELAVPKGKEVKRPSREPDFYSKRGVGYWLAPEWVRHSGKHPQRILPVSDGSYVSLHMLSKSGSLSYIQGSIQQEFRAWLKNNPGKTTPWREDMEMDCLLLGVSPEELLQSDWEYE